MVDEPAVEMMRRRVDEFQRMSISVEIVEGDCEKWERQPSSSSKMVS